MKKGESGRPWRGVDPAESGQGRHWAPPRERPLHMPVLDYSERSVLDRLDLLDEHGLVHWPEKADGVPRRKQYLDDSDGVPATDLITHIPPVGSHDRSRTGHPTQKPVPLNQLFISAFTDPDDVVMDPFCGCGSTLVAAELEGRNWVGADISKEACEVTIGRLQNECELVVDAEQAGKVWSFAKRQMKGGRM